MELAYVWEKVGEGKSFLKLFLSLLLPAQDRFNSKALNAICESFNLFHLASYSSNFWNDEALRFTGYTFEGNDFDSFPQLVIG